MEVVRGIVLKVQAFSDTQKIVHIFTQERGYLSFISPSFIFKKNNLTACAMQVVEAEFYENQKNGLHKLASLSPLFNTSAVYFDIYKMNIALLWSEVLNILLRNEQKNEVMFHFLVKAVEYLNTTREDVANFNLFFLYRLAAPAGFKIDISSYSPGYVFNIHAGRFSSPDAGLPYISGPNAAKTICELCSCKLEELKNISLNRESRNVLLDIILLFFGIHLNTDFNVKSVKVIREVFD